MPGPSWYSRQKKQNSHFRAPRPPGLRGKAIGLYYRDRGRDPNAPRNQFIKLDIPVLVQNRIKEYLVTINNIAKRNKIKTVPASEIQACLEFTELKQEIKDEPIDATDGSSSCNVPKSQGKVEKKVKLENNVNSLFQDQPSTSAAPSAAPDFIPINQELDIDYGREMEKMLSLRGGGDYKYGYTDIITGTFEEKLTESLAKGIDIKIEHSEHIKELNTKLTEDYNNMVKSQKYHKMMEFRKKLPSYKMADEIMETINNNQVVVISGETGCGKSTQVPQLILDDALRRGRGANVHVLVTQPRRIAASSLAERVSAERAEKLGNSIGYAVRLEKVNARKRGSIVFCTTGILLAELEVNQGLTNISHVILDEVHERDKDVDISMCMLKLILQKRKDLKVILMSATLDAERLTAYFDNCPLLHIEGLAYPVEDVYLEKILDLVPFDFDDKKTNSNIRRDHRQSSNKKNSEDMRKDCQHKVEVGPWLDSTKKTMSRDVYKALMDFRSEELNIELIFQLLIHICKGAPGAILVFLPGIADITTLLRLMETSNKFPSSRFELYGLHSKLPSLQQKKIFERPPEGVRKIIVATNIAETSITIDDIVYVIDCGKIKIRGLNVETNVSTLKIEWISQANLRQRRGRSGRCQPGICFHMFTSFRASKLAERLLPELQRSDLLEPVLAIKRLRLGKAEEALQMVMDRPAMSTVRWAVNHLQRCGALDNNEVLTPLGWHLARLPVHPAAGKLLLLGTLFGCVDRAASVAAVWGFKDPFMMVIGKERESDRAKRDLTQGEPSDHVAMSEAIINWEHSRDKRNYAWNNFLSHNTLELLSDMKSQFGDNLRQMGFLPSGNVRSQFENRNHDNISLFKAVVAAALYPNIARVAWQGLYSRNPRKLPTASASTPEDGKIEIHPSSVVAPKFHDRFTWNNPGANWAVFWLKQRSTKLYLLEVTLVYTLPLLFFGELKIGEVEDCPQDCYISISSLKVQCSRDSARMLFELRARLDQVLASKVWTDQRAIVHNEFEEQVLKAVIELITAEDEQTDRIKDEDDTDSSSDYESHKKRWH